MSVTARVRRLRDLVIVSPESDLVVACDSVGGIGPRPQDSVDVPGHVSAHFAARVPLLEVLCCGAQPIALIDTLCQDRDSAVPLIEEFRSLAADAGIPEAGVTGSTEDNVATVMTGIGVTIIGEITGELLSGHGQPGDVIVVVGWPRSAPADRLYPGHPDVVPVADVLALVRSGLVHDALPVGSRGIAWEVGQLAQSAGLDHEWIPQHPVPLDSSGGPSTCVLIACRPEDEPTLHELVGSATPWHRVATLKEQ